MKMRRKNEARKAKGPITSDRSDSQNPSNPENQKTMNKNEIKNWRDY